jgi:hypothetical protein
MQNVVSCLSFRCLPCGCPSSTLTTYVSKALNKNNHMLMQNYCAMRKQLETKVKKFKNKNYITPITGKSVASFLIYHP